ncbi:cobalamin B12-binding domain-containing protein [Candidatus Poribacteria bacterium]|nr:cobalamin B12-binding domain-containing protein [Candidatus Poribacteria bacterium]
MCPMRIHLVYLDPFSIYPPHYSVGVGSVAAVLKREGHEVSLSYVRNDRDAEDFCRFVEQTRPRVVAFSSMSSMFPWVKKLAPMVKRVAPGAFTVCGGVHPTLEPACLGETDGLDAICRGEGEYPFLNLLEALEKGQDHSRTESFWCKAQGEVTRNPLGPLVADLDELPFPDREVFDYEKICAPGNSVRRCGIPDKRAGEFLFTRGCPFDCAFCSNRALRDLYPGKYVRFRSVDKAIEELHSMIDRYKLEVILLHDDIITLNKKWFYDFFTRYANSICLPFVCNSRVGTCDEDMMRLLKEAGCHLLVFGVESGNDYIRNRVLKKGLAREKIIETFALAHRHGIQTLSQNIVGIPGETPRRFIDTINLNADLEPNIPCIGIFHPYPGTELGKLCVERKLIKNDEISFVERTDTALELPGFRANHIRYYHDNFLHLVKRRARGKTRGLFSPERLIPPYPIFAGIIRRHEEGQREASPGPFGRTRWALRAVLGERLYARLRSVRRKILRNAGSDGT